MLGLPGARNISSEVRVIRQGTELSSGLRAFSDKCSRASKRKKDGKKGEKKDCQGDRGHTSGYRYKV